MAVTKHENVVDTLAEGSKNMNEVSQSLHGEDSKASGTAAKTMKDIEAEEEPAQVVPQTPKKGAKKRASVSGATGIVTPKKTKISPTKAKPVEDNKAEASGEDVEMNSKVKKPRTPKNSKTDNANGVTKSAARKRGPTKAAEGIAPGRTIPLSWDDASEADRKLVQMKEAGKSWPEIREMWKTETGQETAGSTLPNRYSRIKVNLEHLEPGDEALLSDALTRYENEKWKTVSGYMEANGAKKYAAAFLLKEAKKIEERQTNSTHVPATSTMITKENGNLTDKEVTDVVSDVAHQNGVVQEEDLGKPDEMANTSGMAFVIQEGGGDQNMDEI
ncbi:hypothetical protein MMC17_001759 [Xylographa soralifera]|nr:hypothetical protein [Xylographa soralifera]